MPIGGYKCSYIYLSIDSWKTFLYRAVHRRLQRILVELPICGRRAFLYSAAYRHPRIYVVYYMRICVFVLCRRVTE